MTQEEMIQRLKMLSAIQINTNSMQVIMDGRNMTINNIKDSSKSEVITPEPVDDSDKKDDCYDAENTSDHTLSCLKYAVETMQQEGYLSQKNYYALIMAAMEQKPIEMNFSSAPSFLKMLTSANIDDLPSIRTLTNSLNKFVNRRLDIDSWTFYDADAQETTHRKNIAKRFRSLFTKAMRS